MIPELIVAITIASEAIGEGQMGRLMVASEIVNRSVARSMKPYEVCTQKKQYSFWNKKKSQLHLERIIGKWRLKSPNEWEECMLLGVRVANGSFVPITAARYHYNPDKCHPSWADHLVNERKIGHHIFGNILFSGRID